MVEVRLKEGDRLAWAIKKFRREVQRAGIRRDIRRRRRRQVQRQRRNEF